MTLTDYSTEILTENSDGSFSFGDNPPTVIRATDTDLAEHVIKEASDKFFWVAEVEKWWTYDGSRWNTTAGSTLLGHELRKVFDNTVAIRENNGNQVEATEWLRSAERLTSVPRVLRTFPTVTRSRDDFDRNPLLFNVANGTIDLRDVTFRPADPADMLTKTAGTRYDTDAQAPEFEKFIREVLPNDETRWYTQKLLGMALRGDEKNQVFAVFTGTGRNGKGALVRVIQKVLGEYMTTVSKNILLQGGREDHKTELMSFKGHRVCLAQELDRDSKWDVASVKSLTGGDDITGRYMREDETTFAPTHTLVMTSNFKPAVPDGEVAFWTRYREIPFTESFEGREDTGLERRIFEHELPGVLNWLLAGLRGYITQGLEMPTQVKQATETAREDSDPLLQFIRDTYEVTRDAGDSVLTRDLFNAYSEWRRENVTAPPISDRQIRKRVLAVVGREGVEEVDNLPRPDGSRGTVKGVTGLRKLA
ncbi:phage/plasmid primase, P4 family [Pseudonocardia sp. N23]|uniref:DNA primase family protein n=1 Tax=Pseudonocardia sp. N23 TaxID=1987376 RepID=UPI000BFC9324|nr:phage/plasmid primase, P4 family [Pseudonocardia sp. N23]